MVSVKIYRGTHQIGGCATEVRTEKSRILIDLGAQLPKGDEPVIDNLQIDGVTTGTPNCDAVICTHSHGDHIGNINRIMDGIPIYMGETSRALELMPAERLSKVPSIHNEKTVAALNRCQTFEISKPFFAGEIKITPFMIDHSAFDAYMFLIEVEGKRILHTGDFRLHGFRGNKTIAMLKKYVGEVDCIICEGTTLSRDSSERVTERELQLDERELMLKNKKVFVLCSSMNIDRIAAFIHANPDGRPVICDDFQKDVLKYIESKHGSRTPLYRFGWLNCKYDSVLRDDIKGNGCLCFIRANSWSEKILKDQGDDALIVYSMWKGYLSGETENKRLTSLLAGRNWTYLHTSGHAYAEDLVSVCNAVNPKVIIPMHTEAPERFKELFPDRTVALLNDGDEFDFNSNENVIY